MAATNVEFYKNCTLCDKDINNEVVTNDDKCIICDVDAYKLCEKCDAICDTCQKQYCRKCVLDNDGIIDEASKNNEYDVITCHNCIHCVCGVQLTGQPASFSTRCGQCYKALCINCPYETCGWGTQGRRCRTPMCEQCATGKFRDMCRSCEIHSVTGMSMFPQSFKPSKWVDGAPEPSDEEPLALTRENMSPFIVEKMPELVDLYMNCLKK